MASPSPMKYLVVTGGVISGLGKGISISSMGVLLKAAGLRVTAIKIDPYLNSDAGTMSPFEHGEVFVLNDGGEADLDLGNYERFLDITLTRDHNVTTGKVYSQVINAERRGDYLGKTVQVIPHVTDAIQDWIDRVSHQAVDAATCTEGAEGVPPDICLIEVGGTVGDIESLVFLEALRQFQFRVGADNICFVHVSLVPTVGSVGEQKTKPTQHSVKELRSVGLNPDIIICRSSVAVSQGTREKLALFCQVPPEHCLTVHDVSNIYHVPLLLESQGASGIIARKLKIQLPRAPEMSLFKSLAEIVDTAQKDVHIALVGKYTGLQDSYLSVIKSLQHASIAAGRRLVVEWIDATALEPATRESDSEAYVNSWETLKSCDGILVPGGFGDRGVEGKILAVKHAREHKVPFLGICLGMQCAVIEYSRNVLGLDRANSAEFDPKGPHPVVVFMPEINPTQMGGTMRLGARATLLRGRPDGKPSLAKELYGRDTKYVWERHRHRYEVNPEYVDRIQSAGLFFTGTDDRAQRMEIVELDRDVHPFFFAAQYHPEFQSHPHRASPPFLGFIYASSGVLAQKLPLPTPLRRKSSLSEPGSPGRGYPKVVSASSSSSSSTTTSSSSSSTSSGSAVGAGADSTSIAGFVLSAAASNGSGAVVDAAAPHATSGRPPLSGSATTSSYSSTPASSSGTVFSGPGSNVQASPARPYRQVSVPTIPTALQMNSVAPPDGSSRRKSTSTDATGPSPPSTA